jgi:uncharacterized protein
VKLIDISALPAVPWKNGGGTTRTLAVSPGGAGFDDFVWRVSIADVAQSGSFSLFPDVDRTIVLLEGEGMILRAADGSVHALTTPFEPHSMPGERAIDAELVNGVSRDFNLMVRRGRAHAAMKVWRSADDTRAALLYCARGIFQVGSAPLQAGWASIPSCFQSDVHVAPESPDAVLIGVLFDQVKEKRCW